LYTTGYPLDYKSNSSDLKAIKMSDSNSSDLKAINMSDSILHYLALSQPSLFIPRVFNNITEARIRKVIDDLGLGCISQIEINERRSNNGETFKRVCVHFEKWYWNEDAKAARRKLISGKEIKIVYDNPWFWKVSALKWMLDLAHPRESKAHIDFSDDTDEFGRDVRLRTEHRPRDDSRERRRSDNRRRDDSRECPRENKERPRENKERPRENKERSRGPKGVPVAPTLTRKADKSVTVEEPRSPVSPPRSKILDFDTPVIAQWSPDYSNTIVPKKRSLKPKKSDNKLTELELGEVLDGEMVEMSEENRKACEALYGDL
jgi:hypothetical protein